MFKYFFTFALLVMVDVNRVHGNDNSQVNGTHEEEEEEEIQTYEITTGREENGPVTGAEEENQSDNESSDEEIPLLVPIDAGLQAIQIADEEEETDHEDDLDHGE